MCLHSPEKFYIPLLTALVSPVSFFFEKKIPRLYILKAQYKPLACWLLSTKRVILNLKE